MEEETSIQEVRTPPVERSSLMVEVLKVLRELSSQINRLGASTRNDDRPSGQIPHHSENSRVSTCWGCKKTGHLRRDCKEVPWTPRAAPTQGNGRGPQQ